MDSKLTHDPRSEKLTFRQETIDHQIDLYDIRKNQSRNLQFFIGLLITLIIALLSTKLETLVAAPTTTQWFLSLGLVAVAALTLWKSILLYDQSDPIKDLKDSLYDTYINKPDVNALFIIKRKKDGQDQILVNRNSAWGCYFLPYKGIREKVDDIRNYSQSKIENILDLPAGSTKLSMLLEQHEKTEKYHPQEKVVKEYHSFYFHLTTNKKLKDNHPINSDEFSIGERLFEWKTLSELEKDPKTTRENGDVLRLLRDNINPFIVNSMPFHNV